MYIGPFIGLYIGQNCWWKISGDRFALLGLEIVSFNKLLFILQLNFSICLLLINFLVLYKVSNTRTVTNKQTGMQKQVRNISIQDNTGQIRISLWDTATTVELNVGEDIKDSLVTYNTYFKETTLNCWRCGRHSGTFLINFRII